MRKTRIRIASIAAVLVLAAVSFAGQAWGQEVQLAARQNKVINGIEAELRGDFRADVNPIRLNAELENINLPVGTPVAFCLLQNAVTTKIGVGRVAIIGGIQVAEVEINANDGGVVPNVSAGDVLQARQRKIAPFRTNPTCGTGLLVAATFQ